MMNEHIKRGYIVEGFDMAIIAVMNGRCIKGKYIRTIDDESIEIEVCDNHGTRIVKIYNDEIIDDEPIDD